MKNTMKSKDSLLEQFKNYETDTKQVLGGYVTGGMQNGGMSYIDQWYDNAPHCDLLVSQHDQKGWIDHIYEIYNKSSN